MTSTVTAARGLSRGATFPRVGVLALQGDFGLHLRTLERLGVPGVEVRRSEQLDALEAVILPGGESTAMLKLMEGTSLERDLKAFHTRGGALFGTCAGLILLARDVRGPAQRSLGLLDAVVDRNAYGRQADSFETDLAWAPGGEPLRGVFIRAPRIAEIGPGVTVLAEAGGAPILVRQGRTLAAAFHPEATDETRVHGYFLTEVVGAEVGG